MISTFKAAASVATVRSASASASTLPKAKATAEGHSENVSSAFDLEKENNINLINKRRKETVSINNVHKRQPSDPLNGKQPQPQNLISTLKLNSSA